MKTEQRQRTVELAGKPVQVTLSRAAVRALQQRKDILYAEMELYFSCLIRMQVRFYDEAQGPSMPVSDKLAISFRPVMTAACDVNSTNNTPPLTDFPIVRPDRFAPKWLFIDYKAGCFRGEYGFLKK